MGYRVRTGFLKKSRESHGERITRWVLPKHGITYGWNRGTIVLLMYGPNADDADMREFVLSLKLTQTV